MAYPATTYSHQPKKTIWSFVTHRANTPLFIMFVLFLVATILIPPSLPFSLVFFSQCRSRAVTLTHSPFDPVDSQNSHWSVFIHDKILMVSRATSTEHHNPHQLQASDIRRKLEFNPKEVGRTYLFSPFSTCCSPDHSSLVYM